MRAFLSFILSDAHGVSMIGAFDGPFDGPRLQLVAHLCGHKSNDRAIQILLTSDLDIYPRFERRS